jgi:hypothetical protein
LLGLRTAVREEEALSVRNLTQGFTFDVRLAASSRQREFLLAGGVLNTAGKK